MNLNDVIKEMIDKSMNKHELYSVTCKVDSVDATERTCICTPLEGAQMEEIKIQASTSLTEGIYIKPVVDSFVIITFLSKERAFVSLFSEIDEIKIDVQNTIVFNGGSFDGLVKVNDLTTKLNNLITQLGVEQALIAAGIAAGGGSYTPGTLSSFNAGDYKNTDIKH